MEDKLVLVNQKLKSLWLTENKFDKESGEIFALAVIKMALAKNIKLAEGTLKVWEECVIEDIRSNRYELEDFISATKKVIRSPLFNRIDFADIYIEAIEQAKRRMRILISAKLNEPKFGMPSEVKKIISQIK